MSAEAKTIYQLSEDVQRGLYERYKEHGAESAIKESTRRIAALKSAILVAWFAEYGFEPGKAVLVEVPEGNSVHTYIRESTPEERAQALQAITKRPESAPFKGKIRCPHCEYDIKVACKVEE